MRKSRSSPRLAPGAKPAVALLFVLAVMSIRVDVPAQAQTGGVSQGICVEIRDGIGYNVPCRDDGGGAPPPDDDGIGGPLPSDSGGGGGCTPAYNSGVPGSGSPSAGPSIGDPHPDHPNLVWSGDGWKAGQGYEWVNKDDPNDLRVRRIVGSAHPDHPNLVWSGDGWKAGQGYEWVNKDDPNDLRVRRIVGSTDADHPNLVWDGDGWRPKQGYEWVEGLYDWHARRIVGSTDADHPNLVWGGDGWKPMQGYEWVNDDAKDLSIVRVETSPPTSKDNAANWREAVTQDGTGPLASLHIADVPSPAGYTSEWERRAQLALLSDERIETELERIQRLLVVMKKDFENDTEALQSWYEETQKAEKDALMASFQLITGSSLKKWETAWKQYPKLKLLAENGLRYLSFEGPVVKLAENPLDEDANREMARSFMLELYSVLRSFDEDLISENGPPMATFAAFLVEYSYDVTRWAIARGQMEMIVDNLDKPNGRLNAQLAIKRLQEDLFEERWRRQNSG